MTIRQYGLGGLLALFVLMGLAVVVTAAPSSVAESVQPVSATPVPTFTPPPMPPNPRQRPTVSITAPPRNAQYDVGTPITVTLDARDEEGLAAAEFYVGQTRMSRREYAARPTRLIDSMIWTPTQVGTYTLSAIVYDDQYVPSITARRNVRVIRRVTIPQVRIDYPQGRVVIMQNTGIDIRGTATDVSGVQRVELWVDGLLVTARESIPQQFVFRWATDRIGDHDVWVRAISRSGGVADSAHVTIGVADDNPPNLKVRLIQDPVPLGTPIEVHVKAYDSKGVTRISLLVSGNAVKTWDAPDPRVGEASVNITQKWKAPGWGTYNLNVQAWDSVGKYSISPLLTVTVN